MDQIITLLQALAPYIPTLLVIAISYLILRNKESRIDVLKERIQAKDEQIKQLEAQSSDALTDILDTRVKKLTSEILRLNEDEESNRQLISDREKERDHLKERLASLHAILAESEFLCPECGAPLATRTHFPMSGYYQGREVDYDVEHIEYECGLVIHDGGETHPCSRDKQPAA